MNFVLFDDYSHYNLWPLTFTRPIADLRVGIFTLREKWAFYLQQNIGVLTAPYLHAKYETPPTGDNCYINAAIFPTQQLCDAVQDLPPQTALKINNTLLAFRSNEAVLPNFAELTNVNNAFAKVQNNQLYKVLEANNLGTINRLHYWWDLFAMNGMAIIADFEWHTHNRLSQPLSNTNILVGQPEKLFIEQGASIEASMLNTTNGPIYIGKNVEVMEGVAIRGPVALCDHATLKMGAKIYGATTIGPHAKIGGEVNNSVILGYSNKAHDGFMGNSVIGEWCNWGADSNNSNLKNNYSEVQVWAIEQKKYTPTGLQFCGMVMGDHAKCGINTMFNTGTVVGVSANVFGADFPPKHIPSFAWGGGKEWAVYDLYKAIETAKRVYARRQLPWTEADSHIFETIFKIQNNAL